MNRGKRQGKAGGKRRVARATARRMTIPRHGQGGVSTEGLMRMAQEMAGLSAVPQDSGIHVPGKGIRRILFTLDANVGLLLFARQRGYDCVLAHHPCGTLLNQGEVYRRHISLAIECGIPPGVVQAEIKPCVDRTVRRIRTRRFRSLYYESPNQTALEPEVARMLGLPFLNVHNPLDEVGRQVGQALLDKVLRRHPQATLGDLKKALYLLGETRLAAETYDQPLEIAIGRPDSPAGRAAFVHGALSVPEAAIVQCYWRQGIRTVVALHASFDDLERLRQDGGGNLILTSHYAGDSYGFTPFIKAMRDRGLTVDCVGGVIDVAVTGHPSAISPSPRKR